MRRYALLAFRLAALGIIAFSLHRLSRPSAAEHPPATGIPLPPVKALLPGAAAVVPPEVPHGWCDVLDAQGRRIGRVASTSPEADHITGYLGPVPVLIAADTNGRIRGMRLLKNREEHEFVDACIQNGMLARWNGMDAASAAAAKVDIVTGATFTSRAIRNGVRVRLALLAGAEQLKRAGIRWSWRDTVTGVLILTALVVGFARGRWRTPVRVLLALAAIGWLGWYTGYFVSQQLLYGWAAMGVPWQAAPSLVLLVVTTLAVPVGTGRALYCGYLCPHGLAQEWIGRISPLERRVPEGAVRVLRLVPGVVLLVMLGLVLGGLPRKHLSSFEPFAAYVLAAGIPLVLAAAGWAVSVFVRRPWCRFGCATGALLRFLQRPPRNVRFGLPELAAVLATVAAVAAWAL